MNREEWIDGGANKKRRRFGEFSSLLGIERSCYPSILSPNRQGSRSAELLFMVGAVHFRFAGLNDLHGVRMPDCHDRLLIWSTE